MTLSAVKGYPVDPFDDRNAMVKMVSGSLPCADNRGDADLDALEQREEII
jgi:hypothetical protein